MPIISQRSVQVVSQSSGLNPPLNFYLTTGRPGAISLNPAAFLLQGLSASSIGQTSTTSGGPDFDYLVYTLTHGPDPSGETFLSFVLSATPVGGGNFAANSIADHEFVPGGNAPDLTGACFDSFDLRITDFSQSAAANGRVTGSITVEFTINGCYLGSGVIFHYLPCFLVCFFSSIVDRLHRFRRRT
jgi:hypothetical protein